MSRRSTRSTSPMMVTIPTSTPTVAMEEVDTNTQQSANQINTVMPTLVSTSTSPIPASVMHQLLSFTSATEFAHAAEATSTSSTTGDTSMQSRTSHVQLTISNASNKQTRSNMSSTTMASDENESSVSGTGAGGELTEMSRLRSEYHAAQVQQQALLLQINHLRTSIHAVDELLQEELTKDDSSHMSDEVAAVMTAAAVATVASPNTAMTDTNSTKMQSEEKEGTQDATSTPTVTSKDAVAVTPSESVPVTAEPVVKVEPVNAAVSRLAAATMKARETADLELMVSATQRILRTRPSKPKYAEPEEDEDESNEEEEEEEEPEEESDEDHKTESDQSDFEESTSTSRRHANQSAARSLRALKHAKSKPKARSSSYRSKPSRTEVNPNIDQRPCYVHYVVVNNQYIVSREEAAAMSSRERSLKMVMPIRWLINQRRHRKGGPDQPPTMKDIFVVAKDIATLIHKRRGSIAKAIASFHPVLEKGRVRVYGCRSPGKPGTQLLTVLSMTGVERLMNRSKYSRAKDIWRWTKKMAQTVIQRLAEKEKNATMIRKAGGKGVAGSSAASSTVAGLATDPSLPDEPLQRLQFLKRKPVKHGPELEPEDVEVVPIERFQQRFIDAPEVVLKDIPEEDEEEEEEDDDEEEENENEPPMEQDEDAAAVGMDEDVDMPDGTNAVDNWRPMIKRKKKSAAASPSSSPSPSPPVAKARASSRPIRATQLNRRTARESVTDEEQEDGGSEVSEEEPSQNKKKAVEKRPTIPVGQPIATPQQRRQEQLAIAKRAQIERGGESVPGRAVKLEEGVNLPHLAKVRAGITETQTPPPAESNHAVRTQIAADQELTSANKKEAALDRRRQRRRERARELREAKVAAIAAGTVEPTKKSTKRAKPSASPMNQDQTREESPSSKRIKLEELDDHGLNDDQPHVMPLQLPNSAGTTPLTTPRLTPMTLTPPSSNYSTPPFSGSMGTTSTSSFGFSREATPSHSRVTSPVSMMMMGSSNMYPKTHLRVSSNTDMVDLSQFMMDGPSPSNAQMIKQQQQVNQTIVTQVQHQQQLPPLVNQPPVVTTQLAQPQLSQTQIARPTNFMPTGPFMPPVTMATPAITQPMTQQRTGQQRFQFPSPPSSANPSFANSLSPSNQFPASNMFSHMGQMKFPQFSPTNSLPGFMNQPTASMATVASTTNLFAPPSFSPRQLQFGGGTVPMNQSNMMNFSYTNMPPPLTTSTMMQNFTLPNNTKTNSPPTATSNGNNPTMTKSTNSPPPPTQIQPSPIPAQPETTTN